MFLLDMHHANNLLYFLLSKWEDIHPLLAIDLDNVTIGFNTVVLLDHSILPWQMINLVHGALKTQTHSYIYVAN